MDNLVKTNIVEKEPDFNLKNFNNEMFGMLTTLIKNDGSIWFIGKEVAQKMGYKDASKAIRIHCKGVDETAIPSSGGLQIMKIISEKDMYRLVMRSKLEFAEKFQDWVCDIVLPSIRKTGSYIHKDINIKSNLDVKVQIENSKIVNHKNYGDDRNVKKIIAYNIESCKLHTGYAPNEIKLMGKNAGLKSKDCSSAKSVLRVVQPKTACSMSFSDDLFNRGISVEVATTLSKQLEPIFDKLLNLGLPIIELND